MDPLARTIAGSGEKQTRLAKVVQTAPFAVSFGGGGEWAYMPRLAAYTPVVGHDVLVVRGIVIGRVIPADTSEVYELGSA